MKKSWQRREFIRTSALAGVSMGLFNKILHADSTVAINSMLRTSKGKRVGIIGLDTSHSIAFVDSLNAEGAGSKYKGYKVVAAYPQGSYEIKSSYERIPAFTKQVQEKGVEIVDSIAKLLSEVDVIMLETNDGRMHRQQAMEVINAGKPLFIDKPMANSTHDAMEIFKAANERKVPVFSSSSLRFGKSVQAIAQGKIGNVIGADVFSPSPLEKTHTDFFWYGIHGIEMLFALMGAGCETVTRFKRDNLDLVVGTWKDRRVGTFRGLRTPVTGYGGNVFGEKGISGIQGGYSNDDILLRVIDFFETGVSPVSQQETLEIAAFIDASQKSSDKGGKRISLSHYLKG